LTLTDFKGYTASLLSQGRKVVDTYLTKMESIYILLCTCL